MKATGPLRVSLCAAPVFLLSACAVSERRAEPTTTITADEVLAAASRVVDCEWAAVYWFDHGQPISDLAQQVMGVCSVERIKAKFAVHLSPNDPGLESDDFKQAVEIVESARKAAPKKH